MCLAGWVYVGGPNHLEQHLEVWMHDLAALVLTGKTGGQAGMLGVRALTVCTVRGSIRLCEQLHQRFGRWAMSMHR